MGTQTLPAGLNESFLSLFDLHPVIKGGEQDRKHCLHQQLSRYLNALLLFHRRLNHSDTAQSPPSYFWNQITKLTSETRIRGKVKVVHSRNLRKLDSSVSPLPDQMKQLLGQTTKLWSSWQVYAHVSFIDLIVLEVQYLHRTFIKLAL